MEYILETKGLTKVYGNKEAAKDVDLHIRCQFSDFTEDTGIGNDQCIHTDLRKEKDLLIQMRNVIFMSHNVHGTVAFHAVRMSILDAFFHFLMGKIITEGTKAEGFPGHVDCVGAISYRRLQFLKISGRRKHFRRA